MADCDEKSAKREDAGWMKALVERMMPAKTCPKKQQSWWSAIEERQKASCCHSISKARVDRCSDRRNCRSGPQNRLDASIRSSQLPRISS